MLYPDLCKSTKYQLERHHPRHLDSEVLVTARHQIVSGDKHGVGQRGGKATSVFHLMSMTSNRPAVRRRRRRAKLMADEDHLQHDRRGSIRSTSEISKGDRASCRDRPLTASTSSNISFGCSRLSLAHDLRGRGINHVMPRPAGRNDADRPSVNHARLGHARHRIAPQRRLLPALPLPASCRRISRRRRSSVDYSSTESCVFNVRASPGNALSKSVTQYFSPSTLFTTTFSLTLRSIRSNL